jgi:hypothetical protein
MEPYKYGTTLKVDNVVTNVVNRMETLVTERVQNPLYRPPLFAALTPRRFCTFAAG